MANNMAEFQIIICCSMLRIQMVKKSTEEYERIFFLSAFLSVLCKHFVSTMALLLHFLLLFIVPYCSSNVLVLLLTLLLCAVQSCPLCTTQGVESFRLCSSRNVVRGVEAAHHVFHFKWWQEHTVL